MTTQIKILAVGSPFGDDRLAWMAAHQLIKRLPKSIPIVTLDRPGAALLTYLTDASCVVIIDAIRSDALPGTILWLTGEDIPKTRQPASSHSIGVGEIFQLGNALSLVPENLHFCGIEIDPSWQDECTLSATTQASFPALIEQICAFVFREHRRMLAEKSCNES